VINKKATNYEEFEAELLRRPGIRKEYDALRPKYSIIRSIIERRNQLQISQAQLADQGCRCPRPRYFSESAARKL